MKMYKLWSEADYDCERYVEKLKDIFHIQETKEYFNACWNTLYSIEIHTMDDLDKIIDITGHCIEYDKDAITIIDGGLEFYVD